MRIGMDMFLDFENLVVLFQPHAKLHVKCLVGIGFRCVVSVFDKFALPWPVCLHIDVFRHKLRIYVLKKEETSAKVYHRTDIAVFVYQCQGRHTALA